MLPAVRYRAEVAGAPHLWDRPALPFREAATDIYLCRNLRSTTGRGNRGNHGPFRRLAGFRLEPPCGLVTRSRQYRGMRDARCCNAISRPYFPSLGKSRPAIRRNRVVFPAPSGPTRPVTRPASIRVVTASSAAVSESSKRFVMPSIWTRYSLTV